MRSTTVQLLDVKATLLIDQQTLQDNIQKFVAVYYDRLKQSNVSEIVVIGILTGGVFAATDIAKYLSQYDDILVQLDFIQLSSYKDSFHSGKIEFVKGVSTDVADKHVLLVDDIYDTGKTMKFAKDYLLDKGARLVDTMTVLYVPGDEFCKPDYWLFEMPRDYWAVGYGLDYKGYYRNLPAIYVISRPQQEE